MRLDFFCAHFIEEANETVRVHKTSELRGQSINSYLFNYKGLYFCCCYSFHPSSQKPECENCFIKQYLLIITLLISRIHPFSSHIVSSSDTQDIFPSASDTQVKDTDLEDNNYN